MTKHKVLITVSIFALFLLAGGFGLYRWFQNPASAKLSPNISKESITRIEKMQETGSISANLRKIENKAGEKFSTSCFSVSVPLPFSHVRDSEDTGKCLLRAQLTHPRGVFVVHTERQPNLSTLQEHSGVSMRLLDETYEQIQLNNSTHQSLAFKNETELTVFVHKSPVIAVIAFSELPQVTDEVIAAAESVVNDIEIFAVEAVE